MKAVGWIVVLLGIVLTAGALSMTYFGDPLGLNAWIADVTGSGGSNASPPVAAVPPASTPPSPPDAASDAAHAFADDPVAPSTNPPLADASLPDFPSDNQSTPATTGFGTADAFPPAVAPPVYSIPSSAPAPPTGPYFEKSYVLPVNRASLPAKQAGQIIEYLKKPGQWVKEGEVIARIDDSEAKAQLKIKQGEQQVAQTKAENDINLQFANMSAEVAKKGVEINDRMNKALPGSVAELQAAKDLLEYRKTRLQAKQAEREMKIDKQTMDVKSAEVEGVQLFVDHRLIIAPFDGLIIESFKQEHEWVAVGDLVATVYGFEEMQVNSRIVGADKFRPEELMGRKVTITVSSPDKEDGETLTGEIIFANPRIVAPGTYEITARVKNARRGKGWALYPNMIGKMALVGS